MTDDPNGRVTTREFYQELIIVKEDIADIKILLAETCASLSREVKHNEEEIDKLQKRSDKWDIITNAVLVPLVTVLSNLGISLAKE